MLIFYRRIFFNIALLAFLILVPFIVIYSLGYSIDFSSRTLSNSVNIRLEAYPLTSQVYSNGKIAANNLPVDFQAKDGSELLIEIKKDNFQEEKFLLWGEKDKNTTIRLTNVSLLPNKINELTSLPKTALIKYIFPNYIIFQDAEKGLFAQKFGVTGLTSQPLAVVSLNKFTIDKQPDIKIVGDDAFFDQSNQIFLWRTGNQWNFLNVAAESFAKPGTTAKSFPFKNIRSIVRSSENQILFLDKDSHLWSLSLDKQDFTFLESNVSHLTFSDQPKQIWTVIGDRVFQQSLNEIGSVGLNENRSIQNYEIEKNMSDCLALEKANSTCNFVVKTFFQGNIFLINQTVLAVSDADTGNIKNLGNNFNRIHVASDTLFWIDENGNLFSWNFLLKYQQFITKIDVSKEELSKLDLFYDLNLKRLFIYTSSGVRSVWFDKFILNTGVTKYFPNTWVENVFCLNKIQDRVQYCLKDQSLFFLQTSSFL